MIPHYWRLSSLLHIGITFIGGKSSKKLSCYQYDVRFSQTSSYLQSVFVCIWWSSHSAICDRRLWTLPIKDVVEIHSNEHTRCANRKLLYSISLRSYGHDHWSINIECNLNSLFKFPQCNASFFVANSSYCISSINGR